MNRNEFVERIATMLSNGVELAEEETGALLKVPERSLSRSIIIAEYVRQMNADIEIAGFNLKEAIYGVRDYIDAKIYDEIDTVYGCEIDDALWRMQNAKDPDNYDQSAEDRVRSRMK
jgi:hypothetical protein